MKVVTLYMMSSLFSMVEADPNHSTHNPTHSPNQTQTYKGRERERERERKNMGLDSFYARKAELVGWRGGEGLGEGWGGE